MVVRLNRQELAAIETWKPRANNGDGGCMHCMPDARGHWSSEAVVCFRLGIFVARLCQEHASMLATALQRARRDS